SLAQRRQGLGAGGGRRLQRACAPDQPGRRRHQALFPVLFRLGIDLSGDLACLAQAVRSARTPRTPRPAQARLIMDWSWFPHYWPLIVYGLWLTIVLLVTSCALGMLLAIPIGLVQLTGP